MLREDLAALQEVADAVEVPLTVVPGFESYSTLNSEDSVQLGVAGVHQQINASLAVQLAACWEQRAAGRMPGGCLLQSLPAVLSAAPQAHVCMQARGMRLCGGRSRPSRVACPASMCRVLTLASGLGGRRWAAVLADAGGAGRQSVRIG